MLRIAYEADTRRAILSWNPSHNDADWVRLLKRVILDHTAEATPLSAEAIALPWWTFLSARSQLKQVLGGYKISLQVAEAAVDLLQQSNANEVSYQQATSKPAGSTEGIVQSLGRKGFTRSLTNEQLRNVAKLAGFTAAATFSVPGAGKTTEGLALFFLRTEDGDKLLVIAPKNAFGAWDEQLGICVPGSVEFTRLRGGRDRIEELLERNPQFMLITYQQLPRVRDLVAKHLASRRVFVYLDESHRIKGGKHGVTAESVLSLSHLPIGKLVMSGTPMPQAESDLIPQFSFLYPEMPVDERTVSNLIKPVYVRTTKRELNLPDVDRKLIELELSPVQASLYALMQSDVTRQAEQALSIRSRLAFKRLGRSIMRLLQVVSNPALLAREVGFAHEGLLGELLAEGKAPKVEYACHRARQLAKAGRKSLIWTSFVSNVELIAQRLSDLGAVYIHGGVDAGDEDDEETREGKIKAFHDEADIRVMVANPAAACEGISLHTVCQNAIYVDRTFNAAHYLQSEDRIHRLGLRPDQSPSIEIVECRATIDRIVRNRLNLKIGRMAAVLDDASLNVDPIPFDPAGFDESDDYGAGVTEEDIAAIVSGLASGDRQMNHLSPGLLYSAQKLLDTVAANPMDREQFLWSFRTVLVSPADGVLALSTRCGWIGINEQLGLEVTDLGRRVQSGSSVEAKLRQQIKDFIQSVQPAWARLLSAGRAEALPFMPGDARQCFREAGLSDFPASDDVIAWWDDLAAASRGRFADYLAKIGREGERSSIKYEEWRVGRTPLWTSIESNRSGYDLLSVTSRVDAAVMKIEVKASAQSASAATFHVSRNEWEVASTDAHYVFHVWSMTGQGKTLAILTPAEVANHMPANTGMGRWESVEIPFRAFETSFRDVYSAPKPV